MTKKETFIQAMKDFQRGKIYFEDLLMAFEDFNDKKRVIKRELLEAARKKGRQMAVELFMDDDYSDSVGAQTFGFFEFEGINCKITIYAFWEKFKHFDYSVTSNEFFDEFGENCIEF